MATVYAHEPTEHSGITLVSSTQEQADIGKVDCSDELRNHTYRHPLGVKPSGNALTSTDNLQLSMGYFGKLHDHLLLSLLEYFDEVTLVNIGSTCRGLFAYAACDQLWRDIAINDPVSTLQWRGSWRASRRGLPSCKLPDIDCSYLFADALYRPFQCSQTPLEPFVSRIPHRNQITRLSDLTLEAFNASWTSKPFILTEPVKSWRVYQDWDEETLLQKYCDTVFRAEAVDWPLYTYIKYMNGNSDESPLYLFDRSFAEKMTLTINADSDYQPPVCFGEDLFMLLGEKRPDHRWLIIGPARSGSTFHKDPNATSAWNAVIRGSKYWIMFPNAIVPPGVYMSEDQSEVTSPLSIAEWLLTFHEEARNTPGCIEGICKAGEVLHVPSGWWHLVVNLEPSIALTQNFVPRSHVWAATNFLRNKSDQVSGFSDDVLDPYATFIEALEERHPNLYNEVKDINLRKRKWEDIVTDGAEVGADKNGFSFGFGSDLEDEEVP